MSRFYLRFRSFTCLGLLLGLLAGTGRARAQSCAGRLYVSQAVAASGAGTSWATAYKTLGEALDQARLCNASALTVREIWVAQGTYLPTSYPAGYGASPADGRDRTFQLVAGVLVAGGFAGTEATLAERTSGHATTLSGDFNGDDVVTGSGGTLSLAGNGENAYHVVLASRSAAGAGTGLDGVTVRGGSSAGTNNSGITLGSDFIGRDRGSGLYCLGTTPTLTRCLFTANEAGFGGAGLWSEDSSPTLSGCTFTANRAISFSGGGLYARGGGVLTLTGCSLVGNQVNFGGGAIYTDNASTALTNCLVAGNYVTNGSGSGLYLSGSSNTLTNCTVVGNVLESGFGIAGTDLVGGSLTVTNCLYWNNSKGASNQSNLRGATASYSTVGGGYGGTGNSAADPLFVNQADPDGGDDVLGTADDGLLLQAGSPARNASNPATSSPPADLLGYPRQGVFDQGAYEVQDLSQLSRLYVRAGIGTPGLGGSWATARASLGEALFAASQYPTITEIWVAAGTYLPTRDPSYSASPADNRDKTFRLLPGLKLYGGFGGTETAVGQRSGGLVTTLSGDFNGNDQVSGGGSSLSVTGNGENAYHVVLAVNIAASAGTVLDGVTVRGGNANGPGYLTIGGNDVNRRQGGGLNSGAASPTLTNCIFSGHAASSRGGALYNANASAPVLTGCTFRSSSAESGGGLYNSASSPTLTGCIFSGNVSSANGGGLFNSESAPMLTNCTFSGNAGSYGAGAYNYYSTSPTFTNCTFSGNASSKDGGGLGNYYSTATLTNCTFSGNTSRNGGGLYYSGDAGGTVRNCLLYGNTGSLANQQNIYKDDPGTALTVSYSTVGDYSATAANNYAASAISTANPLLVNAADPDGADNVPGTADDGLALQAGSPVINAGDPGVTAPTTDLTGTPRVGTFDQGAYEYTQLTLLSATPSQAAPGQTISLSGANLQGATAVTFAGSSGNVVTTGFVVNATGSQLTGVVVPAGAATGLLTVTTPLGTSNGVVFTVCRLTASTRNQTQAVSSGGPATFAASGFVGSATSSCGTVAATVQKAGLASGSAGENGSVTLTAPAGATFVAVLFASYGNPGGSPGSYTQGSCHAAGSQQVVEGLVLGKTGTVTIPATNAAFNGDPCFGTPKGLAVTALYAFGSPATTLSYTCAELGANPVALTLSDGTATTTTLVRATVTSTIAASAQNQTQALSPVGTATFPASDFVASSSSACGGSVTVAAQKAGLASGSAGENGTVTLTAPAGATFTAVLFASYGNPGGSPGSYTQGSCHAAGSQQVVEGLVLGKTGTVTIPATNAAFEGDPCFGIPKRLAVMAAYTFAPAAATLSYTCAEVGDNAVLLTFSDGTTTASRLATATVSVPAVSAVRWTGAGGNGDWLSCGNWQYGLVPTAAVDVTIPAGLGTYPSLPAGTTVAVRHLVLASGATLTLAPSATLAVSGNLSSSSTTTLGGQLRFVGTTAQTVSAAGKLTSVQVSNASGLTLAADLTVSGPLSFTAGTLATTGAYTLTLDPTATLDEANGYVLGQLQATRDVSTAGAAVSFGGLGATITPASGSATLPGSTTVRRTTGAAATGAGLGQGIRRYYLITPAQDQNLNATLTLAYRDSELNGLSESQLQLLRSETGAGGPWATVAGASYDAAGNTVTKAGLSSFSTWTLGSPAAPLPVQLVRFTATAQGSSAVRLAWTTASETASARFEVERSVDGAAFAAVGQVATAGNSASTRSYDYLDARLPVGVSQLYYRLRQVDQDGTSTYSPARPVTLGPAGLALFPNPVPGPGRVTLVGATAGAPVQVLDVRGRLVLQAAADPAGTAHLDLPAGLAGGVYVVRTGAHTLRLTVE